MFLYLTIFLATNYYFAIKINCEFNLYRPVHGSVYDYDCLYYVNDYYEESGGLAFPLSAILYCIRPLSKPISDIKTIITSETGDVGVPVSHGVPFTFQKLHLQNATALDLYKWRFGVDEIDNYQRYLDRITLSSLSESLKTIYNCSMPYFGARCEYSIGDSTLPTFSDIVNNQYSLLKDKFSSDEILAVTQNGTCYGYLDCARGSLPCLDWREICNRRCDCLNDCADEQNCNEPDLRECESDEFRCRNGQCIPWTIYGDSILIGCTDRSDLYLKAFWLQDLLSNGECYGHPFLYCEDTTCGDSFSYVNKPSYSCGDGHCLLSFSSMQSSCKNGRNVLFQKAMLLRKQNSNVSNLCWISMLCVFKFQTLSYNICNDSLPYETIKLECPTLMMFPEEPVLFQHISFFYLTQDRNNWQSNISPDIICYNSRSCYFPKATLMSNNLSCINWSHRFSQWDNLIDNVERIFYQACWTPTEECYIPTSEQNLFHCNNPSLKCFSKHRILDGLSDCSDSEDEEYVDSCALNLTSRFKCTSEPNKCIPQFLVYNQKEDCAEAEDEPFFSEIEDGVSEVLLMHMICDGEVDVTSPIFIHNTSVTDESDCYEYPCEHADCPQTISDFTSYPAVSNSPIQSEHTRSITTNDQTFQAETATTMNITTTWYCNRGILIHSRIDGDRCFCPPSYFGARCEFQNQRISIAVLVRKRSALESKTMFRIAVLLIDSFKEETVAYEQFLYYRDLNVACSGRYETQFLYPNRRSNLMDTTYYLRIDAYAVSLLKNTIEYRASWYSAVPLPSVPVIRLALDILIPEEAYATKGACHSLKCEHGQCILFQKSTKEFCLCAKGWYGLKCDRKYVSSCSPDSLAIMESVCVCPMHKTGPSCRIPVARCHSCDNGGTCFLSDDRLSSRRFYCICPERYYGIHCEEEHKYVLNVTFKNVDIDSSALIHMVGIDKLSAFTTVDTIFQKIFLLDTGFTIYFFSYTKLIYIEIQNNYYLAFLHSGYENGLKASVVIGPSNRCPPVEYLFNQTLFSMHPVQRLKYYHLPCQENHQLKCFYDNSQMCLCESKSHLAGCYEFNHSRAYECNGYNFCENKAKCFEDDRECSTKSRCLCDECYYGTRCQLTTSGFMLSLDAIIGYSIRPHIPLKDQINLIQLGVALTILMSVVGLTMNLFAVMTFTQRSTLEAGCGIYLLFSSFTSLLTMMVFAIKFFVLLATQMAILKNLSFLNVNCKSSEFLLKFLPTTSDWLNACVAIERTVTIFLGVNFNQRKSILASKIVSLIIILFTAATAIHDPMHRRLLVDEEEERVWCVVSYTHTPLLSAFNNILNILHFILPFAINFTSAFIIILTTARKRNVVRTQQTYPQHLNEQFQQHKHLILSPLILVLLALPRLLISFFYGCMRSERYPWLFFTGYFVSFIPSMAIFVVFILPSTSYSLVFKTTMKRYIKNIKQICGYRE